MPLKSDLLVTHLLSTISVLLFGLIATLAPHFTCTMYRLDAYAGVREMPTSDIRLTAHSAFMHWSISQNSMITELSARHVVIERRHDVRSGIQ